MAPIGLSAAGALFQAAVVFAFILNLAKVPVFRRLMIS
jgi:hypothetical protein